MFRFCVVVAAGLLSSGCLASVGAGTLKRPLLQFEGEQVPAGTWKRVRTPDFVLLTDLEPELAQRAALLLAQSLSGLEAMFARAPKRADDKLVVVAMRDDLAYEKHFGRRVDGLAFTWQGETTLFLHGAPDRWFVRREIQYEGTQSVVQHELAHAVLRRYFPTQPRWFAEGMAEYLETFRWVEPEVLVLGDPNLDAYREYRALRSLDLANLLSWGRLSQEELRGSDTRVNALYGLASAFVHYARNKEPRLFAQYLSVLASTENPDQAWQQTFSDRMGDGQLDKDVYAYMKVGQYQQVTLRLPLGTPAVVHMEASPEIDAELGRRLERVGKRLKPAN
jgi:hypothetical protein